LPTAAELLASYPHRVKPWAHQLEALRRSVDQPLFSLEMEQRTGKTKVVIDTAVIQFELGAVDALLIVAMPGQVHRNWVSDEIPAHLPEGVPWRGLVWDADRTATRTFQRELEELLTFTGLAVLAINGEALITTTARKYLGRFLKRRKVMAVGDEFTLIMKTPGTKRTKVMHAIGRHPNVIFKRIMDGTPAGESPLDLYAPFMFLSAVILGHGSFSSYKTYYAEWEKGWDPRSGREFPKLKEYRNLDELTRRRAPHCFRVLRKDCMDIPDKVYVPKHYFELSTEQRRVYDDLRETYEAEFSDGMRVCAANVLTRYLRLQQVTSNYWPAIEALAICQACEGGGCEACEGTGAHEVEIPSRRIDPDNHPRLDAFREVVQNSDDHNIVWSRFQHDVDDVMGCLRGLGRNPIQYDGRVSGRDKAEAKRAFQAGEHTDLVGSARCGGRGLRLDAAQSIHYYSNEFGLLVRLQSEDRAEVEGRTRGTGIHDYCGLDTVDLDIVDTLRFKKSLADLITQDPAREWI
jgi:hypothetical protein